MADRVKRLCRVETGDIWDDTQGLLAPVSEPYYPTSDDEEFQPYEHAEETLPEIPWLVLPADSGLEPDTLRSFVASGLESNAGKKCRLEKGPRMFGVAEKTIQDNAWAIDSGREVNVSTKDGILNVEPSQASPRYQARPHSTSYHGGSSYDRTYRYEKLSSDLQSLDMFTATSSKGRRFEKYVSGLAHPLFAIRSPDIKSDTKTLRHRFEAAVSQLAGSLLDGHALGMDLPGDDGSAPNSAPAGLSSSTPSPPAQSAPSTPSEPVADRNGHTSWTQSHPDPQTRTSFEKHTDQQRLVMREDAQQLVQTEQSSPSPAFQPFSETGYFGAFPFNDVPVHHTEDKDLTVNEPALDRSHVSSSELATAQHAMLTQTDDGNDPEPLGTNCIFKGGSVIGSSEEDSQDELIQKATEDSLQGVSADASANASGNLQAKQYPLPKFQYDKVVPELIPLDIEQAKNNRHKVWTAVGMNDHGEADPTKSQLWKRTQYTMEDLNPRFKNILGAPDRNGDYPRKFTAYEIPSSPQDPPQCPAKGPRDGFPSQIWLCVPEYLSLRDIRALRLVNKDAATQLAPFMYRSAVVKFGREMFSLGAEKNSNNNLEKLPSDSLLSKYGKYINKFGIAYECDLKGLACALKKDLWEDVHKWWGNYSWPLAEYPRYPAIQELEDLVVKRSLMKDAMSTLTNCSELGLNVDSGHGWLSRPDYSDLALLRTRKDAKVFGPAFKGEDKLFEYSLRQYFIWAQVNTLTACSKFSTQAKNHVEAGLYQDLLEKVAIREYDSYLIQVKQPDFSERGHCGGYAAGPPPIQLPPPVPVPTFATVSAQSVQTAYDYQHYLRQQICSHYLQRISPTVSDMTRLYRSWDHISKPEQIQPQWPLIFNTHNVAAALGGHTLPVQRNVADPASSLIHPGNLRPAQALWLTETLWAQREFLSTYVDSVIANSATLKNIRSLHIAKISSGLLGSLEHKDFWTSLENLNTLTLMVSPDWRREHIPGSKYTFNGTINPVNASHELNDFLRRFIAPLEKLDRLTIGFVGGGEHAIGLHARNQHVLPAPVVSNHIAWLHEHEVPDPKHLSIFNHTRELKFVNCWFTPTMLKTFLHKSKDTSLHHLTLESVSMTAKHHVGNSNPPIPPVPLSVHYNTLKCLHERNEWLHEEIPTCAYWTEVLDEVTPGSTILDRKYDGGMIDEEKEPRVSRGFLGNIKTITLDSCGYVEIQGIRPTDFSQTNLVVHFPASAMTDYALKVRKDQFYTTYPSGPRPDMILDDSGKLVVCPSDVKGPHKEIKGSIMMSADGHEGLGSLTSCIHPIEKRVLEGAWGMKFGWGDTMERWAAVEDGCYEGGTGRFSGVISKDG